MAQISLETLSFGLKEAKISDRKRQDRKEQLAVYEDLRHTPNGSRLLCPFCMYSSKKNKMSAIVKHDMFKCFHCNESRRVR